MRAFWRNPADRRATAFWRRIEAQPSLDLRGSVELRTSTRIWGWVWNAANPQERLRVRVRSGNAILAEGVASLYRPDLEEAGIGDGRHGFELVFPQASVNTLIAETSGSGHMIPLAPSAIEDSTPVHQGKEGWLFLRPRIERFYTEKDYFSEAEATAWCRLLQERKERLEALGIPYFHTIAPDKLTVYADMHQSYLPFYNSRPTYVLPLRLKQQGIAGLYIDLATPLIASRHEHLLYWKTDTHWTYHGTVLAVREICRALGVKEPDYTKGDFVPVNFVRDLGAKCDPPIKEKGTVFRFSTPARLVYANSIAKMARHGQSGRLHTGSHVIYRNPKAANPLKLVLFGDSYCEAGANGNLLTGWMSQTFAEVHFMWSSSIDYGYISEVKPNVVLSELAERFVKRFPADGIDLRAFAKKRFQEWASRKALERLERHSQRRESRSP